MAVKDLIGQYESTSKLPERAHSSHLAAARPARFLQHTVAATAAAAPASTAQRDGPRSTGFPATQIPTDFRQESAMTPYDLTHEADTTIDIVDSYPLLPSSNHYKPVASNPATLNDKPYEPSLSTMDDDVDTLVYTSRLSPQHTGIRGKSADGKWSHTPVPATTIFARNAPKLYLPRLDSYISSLPTPVFSQTAQKMFAPMDRLAASNQSLDDLEHNSKVLPAWRSRETILGALVNTLIGLTGSSALATFYSLQGLMNTVQVFALILSTIVPVGGKDVVSYWRKLFLGTVPNILALNFASTTIESLLFLLIFMAIAAVLLVFFHRSTSQCDRYNSVEGLQKTQPTGSQWGLLTISFLLTVIYLPLSTMAVHVLVWSQDLWVVPNPYTNATTYPLVMPDALGPSDEFRDPLDFCWTTTMKRNEINYAPVIIIISVIAFLTLTVSFPLLLRRVIKRSVPEVDSYNELGRKRSPADMDREYQRLLNRDRNTFVFIYSGFRRGWGTFEATYLFAKLSTLIIVAAIDPDNCLFRTFPRSHIALARQVLLLASTVGFFLLQSFLAPFLDPVNNASEWTSRLNYVATAAIALAVVLNIPGKDIFNTYVLYAVYVLTYGLSFYFTIINWSFMHRAVKRFSRRIDFSVDIFSPRLDVSPSSIHTRRRIWQESITTLLLTSPICKIPKAQRMMFTRARDSEYPPYLLEFLGTPAERHVENLKILREVGSFEYSKACSLLYGPDYEWYRYLEDEIQKHFIGPDSYWKNPSDEPLHGYTNFFGNAWWIPFPPTLVIQYDHGPLAVLRTVSELEAYIDQNSHADIQRRRQIRTSLRALDGQTVVWHYDHTELVGNTHWCWGRRYNAQATVSYQTCVLRIKRRGKLVWQETQLGSGFQIELTFGKKVRVDGDVIGLNDQYDLTPALARFLALNQKALPEKLTHLDSVLASYRHHQRKACRYKSDVLTYRFLAHVYNQPRDPTGLAESSIEHERDLRVRELMVGSEAVFQATYERLAVVATSESATWWYIFWDDLWRRNHDAIASLEIHAADFNPHYQTSIAYTPLPRPALEAFLIQRGLMSSTSRMRDFFHSGLLNKIYFRMNETVFRGSNQAILFHMGDGESDLDMDQVDIQTQGRPSSLGTGGGTDHDDVSIRPRPAYRWEGLLDDPLRKHGRPHRRLFAKMGAWFGITPLWRSGIPSNGVSLDVRLDALGRYVLIDEHEHQSK